MAATTNEPRILSRSEFRDLVMQRVREKFGMSLEEFLRAFRAGELDGDSASPYRPRLARWWPEYPGVR